MKQMKLDLILKFKQQIFISLYYVIENTFSYIISYIY